MRNFAVTKMYDIYILFVFLSSCNNLRNRYHEKQQVLGKYYMSKYSPEMLNNEFKQGLFYLMDYVTCHFEISNV